jgi:GPH family glycoside/pentoside/hexuronide:cation symporter
MISQTNSANHTKLPFLTRVIYGSGDWGMASYGTLRQIFYAIFLTDVVGLEARLASVAALVGIIWDAINDPLIGMLSDRVRTRWGRRRPFLLIFAVPFGLGFVLLWWTPPWQSQIALAITITLAFMISDTLQTLISVPFYSLLPEISPDYDERTTITGYRMVFNLGASLVTAVAAPMIVDSALRSGLTQQQGYLLVAAIFGGSAMIPFLLIFLVVRERNVQDATIHSGMGVRQTFRTTWGNIPFRYVTLIYMINWMTFDLVGLMLPYYMVYWVAQGNLLAQVDFFGMGLSLESAVFGLLLIVALIAIPFWLWLAHRLSKHKAYIWGMLFWIVVQCLIFTIKPGDIHFVLIMAVMAGVSVSTAHVLPDALFPDVIEWDELRTGKRQEGIYYGMMNFIRKLAGAVAIFMALQVLGWFGYQAPPEGITVFKQDWTTLTAIRWLAGPVGAVLLVCAITVAWFYPLSRERHARIRGLLLKRREKNKETSNQE